MRPSSSARKPGSVVACYDAEEEDEEESAGQREMDEGLDATFLPEKMLKPLDPA